MTTKDFKGRCYMRGHPRICLNMLGTHLMAVPDICGKKRHHTFCGLTFWELTFWEEPVTQHKQLKACKCKSAKLHSNSSHLHETCSRKATKLKQCKATQSIFVHIVVSRSSVELNHLKLVLHSTTKQSGSG